MDRRRLSLALIVLLAAIPLAGLMHVVVEGKGHAHDDVDCAVCAQIRDRHLVAENAPALLVEERPVVREEVPPSQAPRVRVLPYTHLLRAPPSSTAV